MYSEEKPKYQGFYTDINDLPVLHSDPYLRHYTEHFEVKQKLFLQRLGEIIKNEGSLHNFSQSYKSNGFIVSEKGILYREWLPAAKDVFLFGEFNNWDRGQYKCKRDDFGFWEVFIPSKDGQLPIPHNSKVKIHILNAKNEWSDKIPAWIRFAHQNPVDKSFDGAFWHSPTPYIFKHKQPKKPTSLKIYEVHIGMSGTEERVHTYKEFQHNVLPRIQKLGYNCIQIMALMEHAYYGSFGYHVTNFFAISCRFGNPDDLKELIDTAHGMGIYILMDLVHAHASSNALDGLNFQDGTDYQYFHSGPRGTHELWDSKMFDYGKYEVMRFLLSNLAWYMEEYKIDGFRFDGITAMMYIHRGIGTGFTGGYHEYFNYNADLDALVYLMLANELIHTINLEAITVAEDVSGMPTLGRTVREGGIGFDYRLAMALPDKWIKLLKEVGDEDWKMGDIAFTLTNRRFDEKVISYVESHDQALVGDKTIAMWLFDAEMYWNMSSIQNETLRISRGMALHKMLRLLTIGLGGDAYLTFMGNEWGHPEWIDFPRAGNNWSYHYCRRRWELVDDQLLRYKYLNSFDEAMIKCESEWEFLATKENYVSLAHEEDKIIIFERGNLLFVFNFHPTRSFEHYRVGTKWPHDHLTILDTDEGRFGGQERLRHGHEHSFPVTKEPWHNRPNFIVLYLPCRTGIVLKPLIKF